MDNTAATAAPASTRKARPYVFYGQTVSLCEQCHTTVPAKIVFQNDSVYYLCLLYTSDAADE